MATTGADGVSREGAMSEAGPVMNAREVARYVGLVTESALRAAVDAGQISKPRLLAGVPIWRKVDIDRDIEALFAAPRPVRVGVEPTEAEAAKAELVRLGQEVEDEGRRRATGPDASPGQGQS